MTTSTILHQYVNFICFSVFGRCYHTRIIKANNVLMLWIGKLFLFKNIITFIIIIIITNITNNININIINCHGMKGWGGWYVKHQCDCWYEFQLICFVLFQHTITLISFCTFRSSSLSWVNTLFKAYCLPWLSLARNTYEKPPNQ